MDQLHNQVQQSLCMMENRIIHLVKAEGFIIPKVSNSSFECEFYRQQLNELFPNYRFMYNQTYNKCIFITKPI